MSPYPTVVIVVMIKYNEERYFSLVVALLRLSFSLIQVATLGVPLSFSSFEIYAMKTHKHVKICIMSKHASSKKTSL